jgi:energy-coupling factor transport system ATP-binding protein
VSDAISKTQISDSDIVISAENVSFQYKSLEKRTINRITLKIHRGRFYLLCGPTGSGKTTFIRTINGLIPHFYPGMFYGFLKVNSIDTVDSSTAILSEHIGMVFQNPENQLFAMNVERELAFGLENLQYPREKIAERIEWALTTIGIQELRHRGPHELSGGEQQKVAIASILAMDPDVIVLDEPLSNLDPKSAEEIIKILKRLQKDFNKTILIAEHRLEYVLSWAEELILFQNGEIAGVGSTQQMINDPKLYTLGLDLPEMLRWFYSQHKLAPLESGIPLTFEQQVSAFRTLLNQYALQNPPKKSLALQKSPNLKSDSEPYISCRSVNFAYIDKFRQNQAIRQVSMNIKNGEIVGIIGQNGAGKSTLIRCINGLRRPQAGIIKINHQSIENMPEYEIAKTVGLVFQNPDKQLFAGTLEEELKFSLKNMQLPAEIQEQRIKDTLEWLHLSEFRHNSPFQLSGGQKKKAALATILCRAPNILIFDEPTIGQDADEKHYLAELIQELAAKGTTVIIVSHDLEFIAHIASRVIVLQKGEIFTEGSPAEILTNETLLQANSLRSNEITRLVAAVKDDYPWLPRDIVTVEQLEAALCR